VCVIKRNREETVCQRRQAPSGTLTLLFRSQSAPADISLSTTAIWPILLATISADIPSCTKYTKLPASDLQANPSFEDFCSAQETYCCTSNKSEASQCTSGSSRWVKIVIQILSYSHPAPVKLPSLKSRTDVRKYIRVH